MLSSIAVSSLDLRKLTVSVAGTNPIERLLAGY
jgi:hypothetical protein